MKSNIDLTLDHDFNVKTQLSTDEAFGGKSKRIPIPVEGLGTLTEDEITTGFLTGTKSQIERKKRILALKRDLEDSCHRCGVKVYTVELLCPACSKILDEQVNNGNRLIFT